MGFKEARQRAGLTGVEAAYKLGVSTAAIYSWEAGAYMPETKRLPEIAKLYGCSTEDLLSTKERQPDSA